MPRLAHRLLPILLTLPCAMHFALADPAPAEAPSNTPLIAVLNNLIATSDREQAKQIVDAIQSSPMLAATCNTLATDGSLTGIVVVTPGKDNVRPNGPFQAWTSNGKIMIAAPLLLELRKSRLYDVVNPGDILPNNTAFVLGHLAYHLQHPAAMSPLPAAQPGQPRDVTETIREFTARRLRAEGGAFIAGWNVMIDSATADKSAGKSADNSPGDSVGNNGEPLKLNQVTSLLMNLRYRFAFIGGIQLQENKLQIQQGGWIVDNDANVKALVTVLQKSRVADIE